MPTRREYVADREVIEACRARGVAITARQLERWRHGLPGRKVVHVRGVRGSRTVSPPGYVDQVIAVHDLLATGVSLREAPMVLFARGYPIELESLRAGYLDLFTRLSQAVDTVTPSTGAAIDPGDRADAVAVAMVAKARPGTRVRRWEQRAREALRQGVAEGVNVRAFMNGAVSAALTGFINGENASPEGVREALTVAGFNAGQELEVVAERLAAISFDALIHGINTARPADWATARQDLQDLLRYAHIRYQVEARVLPNDRQLPGLAEISADAPASHALIPVMLIIADDDWRSDLRQQLKKWEATDRLLSDLPPEFHPYLDERNMEKLAGQPASFREELATVFVAWYHAHPDDAATLGLELPRPAPLVRPEPTPIIQSTM